MHNALVSEARMDPEQAAEWTAELIEQRMLDREFDTQVDLAVASGVSVATIQKLLRGRPGKYQPGKLRRLSVALGWTPDSISGMLIGGHPADLVPESRLMDPPPPPDDPVREALEQIKELQEQLDLLSKTMGGLLERLEERRAAAE